MDSQGICKVNIMPVSCLALLCPLFKSGKNYSILYLNYHKLCDIPCCGTSWAKAKKLNRGTKLKTATHEGMQTHLSFSAVPAVDVESILQRECERSVRDVGVGSARRGPWRGQIHW